MRKYRNYTDEQVIQYAAEVVSMTALLEKLGLKAEGGNFANMKRTLQRLGLPCEHWTGSAWNKDQQLKDWTDYSHVKSCKNHLIRTKTHKCEKCNLEKWLDDIIPLEVHHVNGDRTDNRLENLQLLCCNCHAQTENWRNKKKECDKVKTKKKYSRSKSGNFDPNWRKELSRRKVVWPTKEELEILMKQFSKSEIGKQFGVSSTTVLKWVRRYEIVPI